MPFSLSELREFQDKRVRMRFDDDREYVATFLSASQDMDGSLHLIYDKVEWTSDPAELEKLKDRALYTEGEHLLSIEEAEPSN